MDRGSVWTVCVGPACNIRLIYDTCLDFRTVWASAAEFRLGAGDFAQLVLERGQNSEREQLPEEPTTIQQSVCGPALLSAVSDS